MDNLALVLFVVTSVLAFTGHKSAKYCAFALFVIIFVFPLIQGVLAGNAYGAVALCLFFAYLGYVVTKK